MLVLSDYDVTHLLNSLETVELKALQEVMAAALCSLPSDLKGQPPRTVMNLAEGATGLIMPSATGVLKKSSSSHHHHHHHHEQNEEDNFSINDENSNETVDGKVKTKIKTKTYGVKVVTCSKSGIKGLTVILDPRDGHLLSIINATALTGFRTALGTSLALDLYTSSDPHSMFVFGSGSQAFWHIIITLMIRPSIKTVYIWNRTPQRLVELADRLKNHIETYMDEKDIAITLISKNHNGEEENEGGGEEEEEEEEIVGEKEKNEKEENDNETNEKYEKRFNSAILSSQIIITCTPSKEPLFTIDHVSPGTFIGLIGSYNYDMCEVGNDVINFVLSQDGSTILVDSVSACLAESGELHNAGVKQESLTRISDAWKHKSSIKTQLSDENYSKRIHLWKSVGVSTMDIEVGRTLANLAKLHSYGREVEF